MLSASDVRIDSEALKKNAIFVTINRITTQEVYRSLHVVVKPRTMVSWNSDMDVVPLISLYCRKNSTWNEKIETSSTEQDAFALAKGVHQMQISKMLYRQ